MGLANPAQIHEHKRDTLIVLCNISSAGLIGPFFFGDQEGHSVNINRDNYLRMLQEFGVPELLAVANMQQVNFQQDGAPWHHSCKIRAFVHEQFGELVVVVQLNGVDVHRVNTILFFLVGLHQVASLWNKA